MRLTEKKCVPCEGGIPPLTAAESAEYLKELGRGWTIMENNPSTQLGVKKLHKEFKFNDFKGSVAFVNKVAAVAEQEDHHPDILVFYNKVVIEIWTHAIGGLSENDFILAAKIDALT